MKTGIYISGLGQSFINESIEKYCTRLMNEMHYHSQGIQYFIKAEILEYADSKKTDVISIWKTNENQEEDEKIYEMFDFKYADILTENFNKKSLILKNIWLFISVSRKIPLIFKLVFEKKKNKQKLGETFMVFIIFITIALAILFMIPGIISAGFNFWDTEPVQEFLSFCKMTDIKYISKEGVKKFSTGVSLLTALMLLIVPNANLLITNLATEYVCANDYLEHGAQQQLLLGNLDQLVDFISEKYTDSEIHLHSYSFGSILAMDYIYPFGNQISENANKFCKAIITIGTPIDFINSYYSNYYSNRKSNLLDNIKWLNVYSRVDALGSTFRFDDTIGDAEFGLQNSTNFPRNINYEIAKPKNSIFGFLMLYTVKAHGTYWDKNTTGQSCMRGIYKQMLEENLI